MDETRSCVLILSIFLNEPVSVIQYALQRRTRSQIGHPSLQTYPSASNKTRINRVHLIEVWGTLRSSCMPTARKVWTACAVLQKSRGLICQEGNGKEPLSLRQPQFTGGTDFHTMANELSAAAISGPCFPLFSSILSGRPQQTAEHS